MKTRLFPLAAILCALSSAGATTGFSQDAAAATPEAFARTYADIAFQTYEDAANTAAILVQASATLKREPNAISLAYMRLAWVEARAPFLQAAFLRFADGPIDAGENPPVSLLDGRVHPDFIDGPDASIIHDAATYPVIDSTLLLSLNGKGGAAHGTTGYHALEFLLWGPDENPKGGGERPFTDFLADTPLGARRADYVVACTKILSDQLEALAAEWNPETPGNYRQEFLKLPAEEVLARVLGSVGTLASTELAGKWLGEPLSSKDGSTAPSPFSNISQLDVLHATAGIANAMAGAYLGTDQKAGLRVRGTGLIAVIEARDAAQASALRDAVNKAVLAARALKGPFDLAIAAAADDPKRMALAECAAALEALGEAASGAAKALGTKDAATPE